MHVDANGCLETREAKKVAEERKLDLAKQNETPTEDESDE